MSFEPETYKGRVLLEDLIEAPLVFDSRGRMHVQHLRISKDMFWAGMYHSCFHFVTIEPMSTLAEPLIHKIKTAFEKRDGWTAWSTIHKGISLHYNEFTQEQLTAKIASDAGVH